MRSDTLPENAAPLVRRSLEAPMPAPGTSSIRSNRDGSVFAWLSIVGQGCSAMDGAKEEERQRVDQQDEHCMSFSSAPQARRLAELITCRAIHTLATRAKAAGAGTSLDSGYVAQGLLPTLLSPSPLKKRFPQQETGTMGRDVAQSAYEAGAKDGFSNLRLPPAGGRTFLGAYGNCANSEEPVRLTCVGCGEKTGQHLLAVSSSHVEQPGVSRLGRSMIWLSRRAIPPRYSTRAADARVFTPPRPNSDIECARLTWIKAKVQELFYCRRCCPFSQQCLFSQQNVMKRRA